MFGSKRYVTIGINTLVPLPIQQIIWDLIDNLKERFELDYLQVFEFIGFDFKNETVVLLHRQEHPAYEQSYRIKVPLAVLKQIDNKKIFVIDDSEYCTMLFANEY